MKRIWITRVSPIIAILATLFVECGKTATKENVPNAQTLVAQAQTFFINKIAPLARNPNVKNYRAKLPKTIRWDLAETKVLSGHVTVIAPVRFAGAVYVSSDLTPGTAFDLGSLSRLLVCRDSDNVFHYGLITYVPDSTALKTQSFNSGIVLCEDWQGNSIAAPERLSGKSTALKNIDNKQIDVVQTIQVCNQIEGYNYAPDDPAGGVTTWSETSCNTYNLPAMTTGPAMGPGSFPGLLGPKPIPYTIEIMPPTSPIADITAYLKCFTNSTSIDHTYSVTVCVSQPQSGTRDPWGFTEGGPAGIVAAGNPINVGHTFLIFSENSAGTMITRNVGFYPQSGVNPLSPSSQGQLDDNELTSYNISITFSVSNIQFFSMLNYIVIGNNSGYLYDLNTNNCTTFALHALSAGQEMLPSTQGTWPGGSGNDPGDLGEDIRSMTLPPNATRNTVLNPHANQGNCN